jgi:hypothetical protein
VSAIIKTDIATITASISQAHWGVGGDYSRALGVVTNIIVGSTAGATSTQLTANAVAPYAAELIGNTFDHTDDPNKVAQLLSHAVLGGVLAYANGGNAASGALAGAGAEAASLAIAQELYPDAFDADGTFHRDRLSEGQANAILALSGAVGAFVGGVSGGGIQDAVIDANVAQNAVENNFLTTRQLIDIEKAFQNCKTQECKQRIIDTAQVMSAGQDMAYTIAKMKCTIGLCSDLNAINKFKNDSLYYNGVVEHIKSAHPDWNDQYVLTKADEYIAEQISSSDASILRTTLGTLDAVGSVGFISPFLKVASGVIKHGETVASDTINILSDLLKEAKQISPNQYMTTLEDGTKVIFRRDFDEFANHPVGNMGNINHYNIQLQRYSTGGKNVKVENIHIVPKDDGSFIWWGNDKVVKP